MPMTEGGGPGIRSGNHKRIALAAWLLHEAPFVLLAILLGVAFGWRVVAAGAALWLAFPLHLKADQRWPPGLKPKWYRTATDLAVSSIGLSILGALILGGFGALFGFVVGISLALSSIPLSVKNPSRGRVTETEHLEPDRLPLTLQNSPATAKALTIAGFASPALLLLVCVLLLLAHH
jgi:hypothetical protein